MTNKAIFLRKITDLEELIRHTKSMNQGMAVDYIVIKRVELSNDKFRFFANDFLNDREWIEEREGGFEKYTVKCIEVVN